jgi:hypothetical protein
MSARFDFASPCSFAAAQSSYLRIVRRTNLSYPVMDSTYRGCKSKRAKPDLKLSLPPAAKL